ncbi:MAG: hypothetical protein CMG77_10030 [Marinimicrobium sp.]|nr:hypothetical protein [Marinimicrobium sp.]
MPGRNGTVSGAAVGRAGQCRPVTAEGVEIPLTLSIGVTAANAGPGVLATKLVNAADQALYETKAAGRNGMTFRAFT